MSLFTEQERAEIADAIREVEASTAGEIVLHVVGRSDSYAGVRGFAAVALGLGLAKVLAFEVSLLADWSVEVAGATILLAYLVTGWPLVLRRVVPVGVLHRAVHRRALRAFAEDGVHITREATGVLILMSEAERRVEILADAGIHAQVGTSGWERHVAALVASIRERRAGAGAVDVIRAIGQELETAVPPRSDNPDELDNEVIVSAY